MTYEEAQILLTKEYKRIVGEVGPQTHYTLEVMLRDFDTVVTFFGSSVDYSYRNSMYDMKYIMTDELDHLKTDCGKQTDA